MESVRVAKMAFSEIARYKGAKMRLCQLARFSEEYANKTTIKTPKVKLCLHLKGTGMGEITGPHIL